MLDLLGVLVLACCQSEKESRNLVQIDKKKKNKIKLSTWVYLSVLTDQLYFCFNHEHAVSFFDFASLVSFFAWSGVRAPCSQETKHYKYNTFHQTNCHSIKINSSIKFLMNTIIREMC